MVYLATAYDKEQRWLPDSPLLRAHIEQFLSLAANRLAGSISKLRAANLFNRRIDTKTLMEEAHKLLKQLHSHQSGRQWMVGKEPTIANLALYSYIKVTPEGGVSLTDYPALEVSLKRVESLPGFVAMSLSNVGLRGKMVNS